MIKIELTTQELNDIIKALYERANHFRRHYNDGWDLETVEKLEELRTKLINNMLNK
jgi:hypothetical protein